MIATESLSVVFGRTVALDGVTLDLRPGITGVFGPNGSGKSTLLRVLAGLLEPTRGHARVAGREVSLADEAFRRRIGYAGHSSGLYPQLTLGENLELLAGLYGTGARRTAAVLESLGIQNSAPVPVRALSAGLRRRAAVARALLHDPDVLLLDEPYANVDDDASELLSQTVREWSTPERIALIATHGAKKVKRYATAGVILRDGRVVIATRYDAQEAAPSA